MPAASAELPTLPYKRSYEIGKVLVLAESYCHRFSAWPGQTLTCPGGSDQGFLGAVLCAAARWARAVKLWVLTWPPPLRASAEWIRAAAFGVIGVRGADADFLDMIRISGCVATSATDCILGVNRALVCRAARQDSLKNAQA